MGVIIGVIISQLIFIVIVYWWVKSSKAKRWVDRLFKETQDEIKNRDTYGVQIRTLYPLTHNSLLDDLQWVETNKHKKEPLTPLPSCEWVNLNSLPPISTFGFKPCFYCKGSVKVIRDKKDFFYIRCTSKACFNEVITQWDNSWWGSKETYRSIDDLREAWNRRVG